MAASVRAGAVLGAALLVATAVATSPASADDTGDPLFGFSARAVYPYEGPPGYNGFTSSIPADAGPAPGSVTLSVVITNFGDDPMRDISVGARVVTNGRVDGVRCATSPLFPDDVKLVDGVLQGEAPPFPDPPSNPSSGTGATWSDPSLVLAPQRTLYCAVWVAGVFDQAVNETVTTAKAASTSWRAAYDAHTWAASGQLRSRFPVPRPVQVAGSVYLDRDDDGMRDGEPAAAEPLLTGVRMAITGPDGKPAPNFRTGDGVVGPRTTGSDGSYAFPDLRPFASWYTVTLDLDSPALAGLTKSRDADGRLSADGRTWSQDVRGFGGSVNADWRFVPKNLVYVTLTAPSSAIAGSTVTITGRAERADSAPARGSVVLESAAPVDVSTDWTKVSDATNRDGDLRASLEAVTTRNLRFRYLGDTSTSPSVSRARRLSVFTAPVTLHITAPSTVVQGKPLTVSGTIERSGRPFQSGRMVLEHTPADDHVVWTRVAELRSIGGVLRSTVTATRSGYYRWRYLGDSRTSPGKSAERLVVVTPSSSGPTSRRPVR